jgi:hypothetical protein
MVVMRIIHMSDIRVCGVVVVVNMGDIPMSVVHMRPTIGVAICVSIGVDVTVIPLVDINIVGMIRVVVEVIMTIEMSNIGVAVGVVRVSRNIAVSRVVVVIIRSHISMSNV